MALFRHDFKDTRNHVFPSSLEQRDLKNNGQYSCANKCPDSLITKSAAKYKI